MGSKVRFAKNVNNRLIKNMEQLDDIVIEAQAAVVSVDENCSSDKYKDNYEEVSNKTNKNDIDGSKHQVSNRYISESLNEIGNGLNNAKVRSIEENDASVGFTNNGQEDMYVPETINIIDSDKIYNAIIDAKVRSVEEKDASVDNRYESRSLSWLKFNRRVLDLAKDQTIPLFERLKYLSITESNLDEFNMVRLPKLLSDKFENDETPEGVLNHKEYKTVKSEMNRFIKEQHVVHRILLSELSTEGFTLVVNESQLTKKELNWTKRYFENKIYSMLTPLVYDNMRPFQVLRNNKRYIGVILKDKIEQFGTIEVPSIGDRLIEIKSCEEGQRKFILIENLIKLNLHKLFVGKKMEKQSTSIFRVLKSTNYEVETSDEVVVQALERKLKRNEHGDVMRIDLFGDNDNVIKDTLKELIMDKHTIFNKVQNSVVDLGYMMQFSDIELSKEESAKYKYPEFRPRISDNLVNANLFDIIKDDDIILHHPYEPYQTVIDFINQAADDENTVCIKQTLYRVSKDSPIVAALVRAARRGVMVTVVCEVKARFDEINNIGMAREIEKAGGQVIYGVNNLKIHSKMCMVIKSTNKGNLERYVHIGTGNYNEKTSKIYTDISYFTARSGIVKDVENVFNSLTGFSELKLNKIFCSPNGIAKQISDMIDIEMLNVSKGLPGYINIKINSLTDKSIIDKLYEASDAGVKITLIVRGMCALIDTSKITIKSIVGRFLEHSRIYEFGNGGEPIIFISSADLMERNLYNRVELLVPLSGKAKKKVLNIMEKYVKDESAFNLIEGNYSKLSKEIDISSIDRHIDSNVSGFKESNGDGTKTQGVLTSVYSSQEYFIDKMRVVRKAPIHKFVSK